MQRLDLIRACFLTGLGSCVATRPTPDVEQSVGAPNIVIFFSDDQGYGDLSSFGHPTLHTPNVDRLAEEGAKLTQFYVASPVCSPSRAALLTGCYPKRVDMHEHVVFPEDDHGLHPDELTLAEVLRERGYATGMFGKWHLGHRPGLLPRDQGFDSFYGVPYSNDMSQFHRKAGSNYELHLPLMRDDEVIAWEPDQSLFTRDCTQAALEFIDEQRDGPFLLYMPFSMPHIPIYASEEFRGRSRAGLYGDVIEELDWSVGQVLERLELHGLEHDTLVIFTSDNGPWLSYGARGGSAGPLRGGKGSNWEGGQRVPCVMRWPAAIPAGSVRTELLASIDLLPTLAAMAGAELPRERELDGVDVSELLRGVGAANFDAEARAWLYYTKNGALAGVRRGPWKLLLAGCDLRERDELYDVERDISEARECAARHPELAQELAALARRMDAEIEEHARPRGRVEAQLFDPRHPLNPSGEAFEMPPERRRPQ